MEKFRTLIVAMSFVILNGCDSIVDCLDNDGPVVSKKSLNEGILNQVYLDTITASVDNEPRDDRFAYTFTLSCKPVGISSLPEQLPRPGNIHCHFMWRLTTGWIRLIAVCVIDPEQQT